MRVLPTRKYVKTKGQILSSSLEDGLWLGWLEEVVVRGHAGRRGEGSADSCLAAVNVSTNNHKRQHPRSAVVGLTWAQTNVDIRVWTDENPVSELKQLGSSA